MKYPVQGRAGETTHLPPFQWLVTHRLRTACMEMKRAGTLKVSKKTSAAFSRFLLGFSGASVRRTGCWKRQQRVLRSYSGPTGQNHHSLLPGEKPHGAFPSLQLQVLRQVPACGRQTFIDFMITFYFKCPPHGSAQDNVKN